MSWKFVMRTDNIETLKDAVRLAKEVGYKFFLWEENVYMIYSQGVIKTEIALCDLF